MKDHPRVVWMDSSIRFINTGNFSHIKDQILRTGGVMGMLKVGHSIFCATHPQLYEYFPTVMEKVKQPGNYYISVLPTLSYMNTSTLYWTKLNNQVIIIYLCYPPSAV